MSEKEAKDDAVGVEAAAVSNTSEAAEEHASVPEEKKDSCLASMLLAAAGLHTAQDTLNWRDGVAGC